jgi:hypothetical protein
MESNLRGEKIVVTQIESGSNIGTGFASLYGVV